MKFVVRNVKIKVGVGIGVCQDQSRGGGDSSICEEQSGGIVGAKIRLEWD